MDWREPFAQNPRFAHRILHPKERQIWQGHAAQQRFLQCCWSLKEAAYKQIKQAQPDILFKPSELLVIWTESGAVVRSRKLSLPFHIATTSEYFACWSRTPGIYHQVIEVAAMGRSAMMPASISEQERSTFTAPASGPLRVALKQWVSAAFGCCPSTLRVLKDASGVPSLQIGKAGGCCNLPLSLSHDGRFAAFAMVHAAPAFPGLIDSV